jgi:hypothetical protein
MRLLRGHKLGVKLVHGPLEVAGHHIVTERHNRPTLRWKVQRLRVVPSIGDIDRAIFLLGVL